MKQRDVGRGTAASTYVLDDTDWRILSELERDARQSFSELGRRVGLSQPTTAERVKALESHGVIRGYRVDVDASRLGYPMIAFISVSAKRDECKRLQIEVVDIPEVLECHRVTGESSSVLRVAVQSVPHLEQLVDKLLTYGTPSTSLILSTTVQARNVTQTLTTVRS